MSTASKSVGASSGPMALVVAFVFAVVAPVVVALLLYALGMALGGARIEDADTAKAGMSAIPMFIAQMLPGLEPHRLQLVVAGALLMHAVYAVCLIDLRDEAYAVLMTALVAGVSGWTILATGGRGPAWFPVLPALAGALIGYLTIKLARRADPPRRGLAYGV